MPIEPLSTSSGPTTLPEPVTAYFRAEQEKNAEAVSRCFTVDALVTDDARTYNGVDEIQAWIAESFSKFDFTSQILAVEEKKDKILVTNRATGNFPGSPIDFEYGFVLSGDKIAVLEILA